MPTRSTIPRRSRTALLVLLAPLGALAACDDAPTTAVVENAFPSAPGAGAGASSSTTVYRLWWVATLFARPVPPGATSETERTIPATDFAYALLAPGWSPDEAGPPPRLIAVKSTSRLSVAAHGVLHLVVSDDTFTGDCARGHSLSADDAALIVERIFPGDFAGTTYDPTTCTTAPSAHPLDAGDAGDVDGSD